jgi:hypothetical protein
VGDTGHKCYAYVVAPRKGVLSSDDCVTVNKATKPTIRGSSLRRQELGRVNRANDSKCISSFNPSDGRVSPAV